MKQINKTKLILTALFLVSISTVNAQAIPKKPKIDVAKKKQEQDKIMTKAREQQNQLKALPPAAAANSVQQNATMILDEPKNKATAQKPGND